MNLNLINIKKIFYYFFIIFINYFFITAVVFSFSYVSLINGKTYDWFWIKSIQKKIYFEGYRNIWQYNNNCTSYDKNLLYRPKSGECEFNNPEFKTKLKFDNFKRINVESNKEISLNDYILVLGDSVAMGWGVNDDETFSHYLEKKLDKKVLNLAVSSYGTVREIKRLKMSPYYEESKDIIIQYHPNDLGENKELNINKVYSKNDFDKIFENQKLKKNNIQVILGTFKSSLRLFFSDIIDKVFREKNLELIDFKIDQKYLEKVLEENLNIQEKRVIIALIVQPWQKVLNFPNKSDKLEYVLIKLDKSQFFTIDDHPNSLGHMKIADELVKYFN